MPRRKMTEEEKAEKERLKKIEQKRKQLERQFNDMNDLEIPEPVYLHNVGDRIVYGAYDYTEILEVHEGGKFYKCFSHTIRRNTNRGDVYTEKEHYETWYNLKPYRTEFPERVEEEDDVHISFQQRHLGALLDLMFRKWGVDLDPEYQRGNVWTEEQKYNLIDSVFKNIDIGKFTIIRRPWGDNPNVPMTPKLYEMLDGKQRLTALYEFYIGKFKYKGMYYHELNPMDMYHFTEYSINWAETGRLTKEQKYRYFLKLNTTGVPVDPKHLEKVKEMWENAMNLT